MPEYQLCPVCNVETDSYDPDAYPKLCFPCQQRYPPALFKATIDRPFDYALGLRDGRVIRFEGAVIHGDFVTLYGPDTGNDENPIDKAFCGFPCPRGIDIRCDEIIWVADAPEGS